MGKIEKMQRKLRNAVRKHGKKKAFKKHKDIVEELKWLIAERDGVCIGWDPDGD